MQHKIKRQPTLIGLLLAVSACLTACGGGDAQSPEQAPEKAPAQPSITSAASVDIGTVKLRQAGETLLSINNKSAGALTVTSAIDGGESGFSVTGCEQLAVNSSCSLKVAFKPNAVGPAAATITVTAGETTLRVPVVAVGAYADPLKVLTIGSTDQFATVRPIQIDATGATLPLGSAVHSYPRTAVVHGNHLVSIEFDDTTSSHLVTYDLAAGQILSKRAASGLFDPAVGIAHVMAATALPDGRLAVVTADAGFQNLGLAVFDPSTGTARYLGPISNGSTDSPLLVDAGDVLSFDQSGALVRYSVADGSLKSSKDVGLAAGASRIYGLTNLLRISGTLIAGVAQAESAGGASVNLMFVYDLAKPTTNAWTVALPADMQPGFSTMAADSEGNKLHLFAGDNLVTWKLSEVLAAASAGSTALPAFESKALNLTPSFMVTLPPGK